MVLWLHGACPKCRDQGHCRTLCRVIGPFLSPRSPYQRKGGNFKFLKSSNLSSFHQDGGSGCWLCCAGGNKTPRCLSLACHFLRLLGPLPQRRPVGQGMADTVRHGKPANTGQMGSVAVKGLPGGALQALQACKDEGA